MTTNFVDGSTVITAAWLNSVEAVREGVGAPTGADLVGYLPAGTGVVATTVQTKLRESVSVKDFGAVGDGETDDTIAIKAALTRGSAIYFPAGTYKVSSDLALVSNTALYGDGIDITTIISRGNPSGDRVLVSLNSADAPKTGLHIEGISFEGNWLTSQSETGSNGLITLTYWTNVTVTKCSLRYGKTFMFNINNCNTVAIRDNLLEYSSRDMIAVWNTNSVIVTGNILRHNDDDSISLTISSSSNGRAVSQCVVANNQLEDTGSIRVEHRNAVITNNVVSRPRGSGLQIGISSTQADNIAGGQNILITNNVVADVIDRQWFVDGTQTGASTNRVGIILNSGATNAGSLAVAPGEVDPATGTVQSPYDYYYSTGATDPVRASSGIIVSGNVCKRTLPAVLNYSDWGYGLAFTKSGFVDYQVPSEILTGVGINVTLPVTDLLIKDNYISSGKYGIRIFAYNGTIADNMAKNVVIRGNTIKDITLYGIESVATTLNSQDVTIEDNVIDCDPFFTGSLRVAGGSWSASSYPVAFSLSFMSGAKILRNRVSNCASVITQTSVSDLQYIEDNILYCDPAATGYSASNLGIGNLPGIGDGKLWWIQCTYSDPTSANYGKMYTSNNKNYSSIPTTGKWLAGTKISVRGVSVLGVASSRYIVAGYARLTTGSAHVLDTDWVEMRTLTGT